MPGALKDRIETAIEDLARDPRPRGTKKLVGHENEWRLRVGDHRVLYVIDDAEQRVEVARVAHRREVYR